MRDNNLCEYEYLACCGLNELIGFSEPDYETQEIIQKNICFVQEKAFPKPRKQQVYDWKDRILIEKLVTPSRQKPAHIIFSDISVEKYRGGNAFARYIRKHKLGKIQSTSPAYNKNSGNYVKAWLWTPDWLKIKKHKYAV